MNPRRQLHYAVDIQKQNGGVVTESVHCFWSPTSEGIEVAVGIAARIQVQQRTKASAAVVGDVRQMTA